MVFVVSPLDPLRRSEPCGIENDFGATKHHGLSAIDVRHFDPPPLESTADSCHHLLIYDELQIQGIGKTLSRDIIRCSS
jgi:hypothetical protein